MNKPKNNAELIRYLTANPNLECHMPGANRYGHGNAGSFLMGDPNPKPPEPRIFIKKSSGCIVMKNDKGATCRLGMGKSGDIKFFDDRFESESMVSTDPIKYFYK